MCFKTVKFWDTGRGGGRGRRRGVKRQHTLWGDEIQPIRGKSLFADILFASHCGQDTVTRPLQVSGEHPVSAPCQGTGWAGCSSCQPGERQALQPPGKPHQGGGDIQNREERWIFFSFERWQNMFKFSEGVEPMRYCMCWLLGIYLIPNTLLTILFPF